MKNTTTFRLKGRKKAGSYILSRGMAKDGGVLKAISYRPGASSIYDEDNLKSVARRKSVVFKYNERVHDPAVEITVPHSNGMLIKFLTSHQDFGKVYEVYDEDQVNQNKVDQFEKIEKALAYIGEGGDNEVKATAMTIFGLDYFVRSISKCTIALKDKAMKEPQDIIAAFEAPNFHNKYMVSLMFCSGVIKNNDSHTAIQWADTNGTILTIATGENGIDKLTEFISRGSDQGLVLLQEFQSRFDLLQKKKAAANIDVEAVQEQLSEKDREIAELKRALAAKDKKELPADEDKDMPPVNKYEGLTLEEAKELYKEQKGEDVPTAKATKLTWIISQLS